MQYDITKARKDWQEKGLEAGLAYAILSDSVAVQAAAGKNAAYVAMYRMSVQVVDRDGLYDFFSQLITLCEDASRRGTIQSSSEVLVYDEVIQEIAEVLKQHEETEKKP